MMRRDFTNPLIVLAAVCMILESGGCASSSLSDGQKLYAARASYVATLQVLTPLMRNGIIGDQATKDAIYAARVECAKSLDEAEAAFLAGNKLGFSFILGRVNSALDTLMRERLRHEQPATQPSDTAPTPEVSWKSWQSYPSSKASPRFYRPPVKPHTLWRAAASPPLSRTTRLSSCSA